MGQLLSYIGSLLFPRPLPPPLLKLPVEVVLSITSRLSNESPESTVALALTCKSLFAVLAENIAKNKESCRAGLLLLLERDLGDKFFYCLACARLHRFSILWKPFKFLYIDYHQNVKNERCLRHPENREVVVNSNPFVSGYRL